MIEASKQNNLKGIIMTALIITVCIIAGYKISRPIIRLLGL